MTSDRSSLLALHHLITEAKLILETTPDLPQNRTACCQENLRAALALVDDIIAQQRMAPAAIMGSKGGSATSAKRGPEHYRKMALDRETRGGGRPRRDSSTGNPTQ